MSEEEIKAIEFLRKRQEFMHSEPKCVTTLEESIDTLLNLIDKQQKEIEELKKDKKALVDNYSKVLSSFISKEKIKAKIKKEEKYQETTKKLFPDSLNYHVQEYAIEVLKELLEE